MPNIAGQYTTVDATVGTNMIDIYWTMILNPNTFSTWKHYDKLMEIKKNYPDECSQYHSFRNLMKKLNYYDLDNHPNCSHEKISAQ